MSTFQPTNIPQSASVLSSPLRNNFNALQALLNQGLGNDQFLDGALSGLKIADTTLPLTKLTSYADPATWTPTFYKNDNTTAMTAPTIVWSRTTKVGKYYICWLSFTGLGDPGGAAIFVTLPTAADFPAANSHVAGMGNGKANASVLPSKVEVGFSAGARVRISLVPESAWAASNNAFDGMFIFATP